MTLSARLQACGHAPVLVPLLLGGAAIVAGGFVAAATAPTPSEKGSWSAAYLVLVVGVVQLCLAAGAACLAEGTASNRLIGAEFLAWNLGNAAVFVGTLIEVQAAVDVGGALIVLALLAALAAVRPARPNRLVWAYRFVILVVVISVPAGLVLGRLRSG